MNTQLKAVEFETTNLENHVLDALNLDFVVDRLNRVTIDKIELVAVEVVGLGGTFEMVADSKKAQSMLNAVACGLLVGASIDQTANEFARIASFDDHVDALAMVVRRNRLLQIDDSVTELQIKKHFSTLTSQRGIFGKKRQFLPCDNADFHMARIKNSFGIERKKWTESSWLEKAKNAAIVAEKIEQARIKQAGEKAGGEKVQGVAVQGVVVQGVGLTSEQLTELYRLLSLATLAQLNEVSESTTLLVTAVTA